MKIEKYKYLGNGKYKLFIDKETHIIYEDIIIKYNILSKEELSRKELNTFLADNRFYEAYYKAVSYIKVRLRSEREIKEYLSKNGYLNKIIISVIEKLKNDGYINEEIFTEAFINDQINLKNFGPVKIEAELTKLGISKKVIDKNLKKYTKEMQQEKISKMVEKDIKLNKNKSKEVLKNKILVNLIGKGFYREDIVSIINKFDIDDKDIYEKEYQKQYEKLSKKYSGIELEYKIKQKMYQKGFRI